MFEMIIPQLHYLNQAALIHLPIDHAFHMTMAKLGCCHAHAKVSAQTSNTATNTTRGFEKIVHCCKNIQDDGTLTCDGDPTDHDATVIISGWC